MNKTPIEWTDYSANPIKFRDASGAVVWGCVKVSQGCTNCYSEALAHRYRRGGPFNAGVMATLTPFLDEKELHRMLTYKPAAGKRCFVGDMTDIFGEWVPDELLDRLFAVFALRYDVTWQVLTKRPERMRAYMDGLSRYPEGHCWEGALRSFRVFTTTDTISSVDLPLSNVWLGTSVENQAAADERIPHLLDTPAAVRFVSAEPLLGPVDLTADTEVGPISWLNPPKWMDDGNERTPRISWVIVGGESGPGARPCQIGWVRSIVRQCKESDTPVFVKQLGSRPTGVADRISHRGDQSQRPDGFYRFLNDHKGGDPCEWPENLRVRQFPEAA